MPEIYSPAGLHLDVQENILMKKAIILLSFVLCLGSSAASQKLTDTLRLPASRQLFELLPVATTWINTSNPAAISILNIKRFSVAEAGCLFENNDIKYTHQPGETRSFFVGTSGFKTINKVSFFGSFRYTNEIYDEIMYNSTLVFDKWNPYIIADTIGGRQGKEAFDLSGNVSYKISDRLIIAGKVDYLSAYGAKYKDPRNMNRISRFCFTPGIMYKTGKFTFGVNGSVYSNTNDVDIDAVGNNTINYSFMKFLGLGYYVSVAGVTNYETRYPAKGYSIGAQVSYRNGSLNYLTTFSIGRETEESRYDAFFRFLDGTSNTEKYNLTNHLQYKGDNAIHSIDLAGNISYLYGDLYTSSPNVIRAYLQGVPYDLLVFPDPQENAIIITQKSLEIDYHYLTLRSSGLKDFEAGGSVKIDYYYSGRYPDVSTATFDCLNMIATFDIRKTLHVKKFFISPSVEAFYRGVLNSSMAFNQISPRVFPEMIVTNYNAMKASLYGGTFSAELEMPADKGFFKTYFFRPEGSFIYSPDLGDSTGKNFFAQATLGFTF